MNSKDTYVNSPMPHHLNIMITMFLEKVGFPKNDSNIGMEKVRKRLEWHSIHIDSETRTHNLFIRT